MASQKTVHLPSNNIIRKESQTWRGVGSAGAGRYVEDDRNRGRTMSFSVDLRRSTRILTCVLPQVDFSLHPHFSSRFPHPHRLPLHPSHRQLHPFERLSLGNVPEARSISCLRALVQETLREFENLERLRRERLQRAL